MVEFKGKNNIRYSKVKYVQNNGFYINTGCREDESIRIRVKNKQTLNEETKVLYFIEGY